MSKAAADAWVGVVAAAVNQILVTTACLVVAGLAFRGGGNGFGLSLPRSVRRGNLVMWIGGGWLASLCCTGLAAMAVQWVLRVLWSEYQPPDHGVFTMLRSSEASAAMRWLAVLGPAVLAPISEECFFRGILQTALRRAVPPRRSMYHRWFAILVTAGIFGMMHSSTPQFIPALVLFGILLGFVYERTGSLVVVIAIHMLFNIKSLLWFHLQAWV
jgi:membrane protease YdiL (CAAX protease family)